MENVGNTVSSTIPLALESLLHKKSLGNKILLAGFGVGYSWGGVVLSKHNS
jgi:3-oxoacyl-[acyl-carrier-protein] synthase-3